MSSEKSIEKLRRNEKELQDIFNTAPVGLALTHKRVLINVNDMFCKMLGYTRDEFIGNTTEMCYEDKAEYERVGKLLYEQIKTVGKAHLEVKGRRKDGTLIDVLVSSAHLKNSDMEDDFIFATLDITERKKAEKKLKHSNEFTKNLIDTANVLIIGLDTEGKIQIFNPAAEEITGYTKKELEDVNWFEILVPKDKYPDVHEVFDKLEMDNLPKLYTNPIITKDGQERVVTWSNAPIKRNGDIVGTISFGIDITKMIKAEKSLRLTQAAIDQATDLIFWVMPDGTIGYANNHACNRLGYTREELFKMTISDIDPSNPPEKVKQIWNQLRSIKTDLIETNVRTKLGKLIPVELKLNYINYEDQEYVFAYARDITKRKQTNEMLHSLVKGTSGDTGVNFFKQTVKQLAGALNVKYAFIGTLLNDEKTDVETLALWADNKLDKNIAYNLIGTPCKNVIEQKIHYYPENVQKLFPEDKILKEMNIESYLGVPILSSTGEPLGVLVVMDDKPFPEDKETVAKSVMVIFASRSGAELERSKAEENLRKALDKLRSDQQELHEKNVAMKQILNFMEKEKADFKQEISLKIELALMPFVKKLNKKDGRLSTNDIESLEDAIQTIVGHEIEDYNTNYAKLTSREMDICELIKEGKSSQEIADKLNLSVQTIQKHRTSIRDKLQLKNKDINLPAYLRTKN